MLKEDKYDKKNVGMTECDRQVFEESESAFCVKCTRSRQLSVRLTGYATIL